MPDEQPVDVVRRFWDLLVHEWALHEAGEIVTGDFAFRSALGVSTRGRGGFVEWAHQLRRALPDLRVALDDVQEVDRTVAARLLFSGTHSGPLFGVPATRRLVTYEGAGFFDVTPKGKLSRVWLVADTHDLYRQLTAPVHPPRQARPLAEVAPA